MLRVVIDTSSLVSYVLTRGEFMRRVIALWEAGEVTVLSSPQTRAELDCVLARPAIARLSTVPLGEFAAGLERFTTHVPGRVSAVGACRDSKDEKFLACAVEGGAHYLVTSDRDLLDLRRYETVGIVNPGQLLLAVELASLDPEAMIERFGGQTLDDILVTIPLAAETQRQVEDACEMCRERGGSSTSR